ncbi:glycosyltransferase [Bacteroidales bacterium]|nr:glycosyltransferase [Bacteroidales bacterium]
MINNVIIKQKNASGEMALFLFAILALQFFIMEFLIDDIIGNATSWYLYVFAFLFLFQMRYFIIFFNKFLFFKDYKGEEKKNTLSVVICAKNEAANLAAHLPFVLEQKYKEYEVIVVNDASTDESEEVLYSLSVKYPHLKVRTIYENEKFSHGKKLAITLGIKAASNEWIVHTDADCKPVSENWLTELSKSFTNHTEIVLGYGAYEKSKGWLNKIITFDTFHIALNYFSLALAGKAYMGVGRNMAYRRSVFFSKSNFANHAHILSGDDDLFVNEVAGKYNVKICKTPGSFTVSKPKTSFRQWYKQKRRHLTAAPLYKKSDKRRLIIEPISRVMFYVMFVTGYFMLNEMQFLLSVSLFLLRLIYQAVLFKIGMNRLNEKYLFITSLIYDMFYPILVAYILVVNKFQTKQRTWS